MLEKLHEELKALEEGVLHTLAVPETVIAEKVRELAKAAVAEVIKLTNEIEALAARLHLLENPQPAEAPPPQPVEKAAEQPAGETSQ